MKKPVLLISIIFFIIITLTMVRVAIVNSISTTGIELVNLQNELKTYQNQNALLNEQYLELSSLTNIESKAEKLGFVEAKSQVYLSTPLPLALRQ